MLTFLPNLHQRSDAAVAESPDLADGCSFVHSENVCSKAATLRKGVDDGTCVCADAGRMCARYVCVAVLQAIDYSVLPFSRRLKIYDRLCTAL